MPLTSEELNDWVKGSKMQTFPIKVEVSSTYIISVEAETLQEAITKARLQYDGAHDKVSVSPRLDSRLEAVLKSMPSTPRMSMNGSYRWLATHYPELTGEQITQIVEVYFLEAPRG